MEKFSIQKTDSEIMRDALSLLLDEGDTLNFLSRADEVYSQTKVGNNIKFELLRNSLKSDPMFFQFVLFRGSKTHKDVGKMFLEYAENIKMMEGKTMSIFQREEWMDKKEREDKIDELCKQDENHNSMMMKQPRRGPQQVEPACYKR